MKDHPEWVFLLSLDGFPAHTMSPKAMEIFRKANIVVILEESHTSQTNQSFDRQPAKASKTSLRTWLPLMRSHPAVGFLDQWTLLILALQTELAITPKTWVQGFRSTNLHPHYRVPFNEWLKKIEPSLAAAAGFANRELSVKDVVEIPSVLGTADKETRTAIEAVFRRYDEEGKLGSCGFVERLMELKVRDSNIPELLKYHFSLQQIESSRRESIDEEEEVDLTFDEDKEEGEEPTREQCVNGGKEREPEDFAAVEERLAALLSRETGYQPELEAVAVIGEDEAKVSVEEKVQPEEYIPSTPMDLVKRALSCYLLHPPDLAKDKSHVCLDGACPTCSLRAQKKLKHLIRVRKTSQFSMEGCVHRLGVATTPSQLRICNPGVEDFRMGELLEHALVRSTGQKRGRRQLNCIGELIGKAAVLNTPERIAKLQAAVNLASALEEITMVKRKDQAKKRKIREEKVKEKVVKQRGELPVKHLLMDEGLLNNLNERVTKTKLEEYLQKKASAAVWPKRNRDGLIDLVLKVGEKGAQGVLAELKTSQRKRKRAVPSDEEEEEEEQEEQEEEEEEGREEEEEVEEEEEGAGEEEEGEKGVAAVASRPRSSGSSSSSSFVPAVSSKKRKRTSKASAGARHKPNKKAKSKKNYRSRVCKDSRKGVRPRKASSLKPDEVSRLVNCDCDQLCYVCLKVVRSDDIVCDKGDCELTCHLHCYKPFWDEKVQYTEGDEIDGDWDARCVCVDCRNCKVHLEDNHYVLEACVCGSRIHFACAGDSGYFCPTCDIPFWDEDLFTTSGSSSSSSSSSSSMPLSSQNE